MKLNEDLKKVFKDLRIPEQSGYAFCLLYHFGTQISGLKTFIIDKDIISLENEEKYRIGLLKLDEDGNLVLKYELFEEEGNGTYKEFCRKLAETRVINSRGHLNNSQDYTVYSVSKDVEMIWQTLGDLDLDVAVKTVVNYYENTKPALKIENYLAKSFMTDYNLNK